MISAMCSAFEIFHGLYDKVWNQRTGAWIRNGRVPLGANGEAQVISSMTIHIGTLGKAPLGPSCPSEDTERYLFPVLFCLCAVGIFSGWCIPFAKTC